MKTIALLLIIFASAPAFAVAPASPASCRSVTRSPLGEHLRETVWEITRARSKLDHALADHHARCQKALGDLRETSEMNAIEKVADEARKINAELLDLEDEYLRTAESAADAAHLLRQGDCEERIKEQRQSLKADMDRRIKEVYQVLAQYCR